MGLFSRGSPAEKKLKELTGGFLLSTSFVNRLKSNNLDISEGTKIKEQLKEEIKQGAVDEYNLESRLSQLIDQHSGKNITSKTEDKVFKKRCPKCSELQEADNRFCIFCGYDFNKRTYSKYKKCPNCGIELNEEAISCKSCGYDFIRGSVPKFKNCPICGVELYDESKTCKNCGYDFVNKRVKPKHKACPNCGINLFESSKVCIYCGYDFESQRVPGDYINCPNCNAEAKKTSKTCPKCGYVFSQKAMPEALNKIRKVNFLASYDFNLKTCPECNVRFLKTDPFCFNCGTSVLTNQTVKNDNLEVRDGKLVAKDELSQKDELSELEALYSQAVQSKYSPSFKVAYTLCLEEFRKNPTRKFSDKIARQHDTTVNKLKKQALEDEFVELASPLAVAKDFKVSDLKEILKEHNLKVSGKKDELIERLGENLSDDELKKHFKSKTYQVSDKGLEFLSENSYILYIYGNSDVSRVFYPSEIAKIFEDREYSIDEIRDIVLKYLKRVFDEKLTQELWVDFKSYANAIAFVLEDKGELKEALNIRFKVFLFDINNFSIVLGKPDPRKTKLKQKDMSKLMNLLHDMGLSIDELKELFSQSYNEVLFKVEITKEDSLIYLLKIFGGEDLDKVSIEINESYSSPH